MGLSWNMSRGSKDRVLLSCGICPYLKSRLIRQKMLNRTPICEIVESALLAYLPKDDNRPIVVEPRQHIDYNTWVE